MELISKELKNLMAYLRISEVAATLPERISYAKAKKILYEEFLELVLSDEFERREARTLNVKMKKANVSNLDSYNWDTATQYDRELTKNCSVCHLLKSYQFFYLDQRMRVRLCWLVI